MEPLALLCNLYGDGPKTLRRLQRVGFESLASLLAVEAEVLAERTGWPRAEATLLLQQARALATRTDSVLLEPEADSGSTPSSTAHDRPPVEEEAPLTDVEADARGRLLETWRQLDGETPPPVQEDVLVPSPPPVPSLELTALEEGVLPGALRTRLQALGIRGIEDLVSAPTLELAREVGLGFTRLRRLQHLARHKLAGAHGPERSQPRLPLDPGVGGPFA